MTCAVNEEQPTLIVSRTGDRARQIAAFDAVRGPPSRVIKENNAFILYLLDELRYVETPERFKAATDHMDAAGFTGDKRRDFWHAVRQSAEFLSQDVFASAPVRTQPFRVYTPSDLIASAEGTHVPLTLSRAKLRSPSQWEAIKHALVSFGKSSGLFTDIEIKQFGKSDIDPFQVLVRVGGPLMNLADVGYGVSQILPILYQIQNPSEYSTFLVQQPEVHLHPRAQAEIGSLIVNAANSLASSYYVIETHSDYIIDRVRIEIARKKIDADKVGILYFHRTPHGIDLDLVSFDDRGEILHPPDGFRSFFLEEHARLLGIQ